MLFPYLVCTTGPFLPPTASGNSSKSAMSNLCPGNFSLSFSAKRTALVGKKSGAERLGTNGIDAYALRNVSEYRRG